MNRNDVLKVLAMLEVNYVNHFNKLSKEQFDNTIMLWVTQFKDDDPNVIANAIQSIIATDTSPFPPQIATVKKMAYELTHKSSLTEQEVVKCLKQAISNSGYYAQQEYDDLPQEVQSLCSPNQLRSWSQIDEREVDTVIMSLVTRGYQKRVEENKKNELLPSSVKLAINELNDKMKLGNKGEIK